MHFLIDADLPRLVMSVLQAHGHDATDCRDLGQATSDDESLAAHARAHELCLLTGDFDFADERHYPPAEYFGIVVLELDDTANSSVILSLLERFLAQKRVTSKLVGRLAIVSKSKIRLRPPG